MTSNDNQQYLTVEMFNSKMDTLLTQIRLENEKLRTELKAEISDVRSDLHAEIQAVRSDLHAEILDVRADVRVNSAKIEMLQHSLYWGFAIMTLVITFVAVIIPYFWRERKQKAPETTQTSLTEDRVKELISQAITSIKTGKTTM